MKKLLTIAFALSATAAQASEIAVDMAELETGRVSGSIAITQTKFGVVFTPNLTGLPAGLHGFHLHVNNSCEPSEKEGKTVLGGAAGGHYDPLGSGKHGYPWSTDNHLGDLPPLFVTMDGSAIQPVLAPRLKLADLSGRALMIHAGGDNHSDNPNALGGGGARLVCGVIK